jgi:hypothetical protein
LLAEVAYVRDHRSECVVAKQKSVEGTCHICGVYGELSFEHVPPKSAFNNQRVLIVPFDEAMGLGPNERPKSYQVQQRGAGSYTLCPSCNNTLGGWYGRAFVEWCVQGMSILERSQGYPKLIYAHHIYPLRVIKQLAVMFLAVNAEQFRLTPRNQELVRILMNKEIQGLPSGYRFYAYYNVEGQLRSNALVARSNFVTGEICALCEITFPPFGYVLTIDSNPPHPRLFDITHFAWSDDDEERTVFLDLPVLPTHMAWFSGDYRTLEEIHLDRLKSEIQMAMRGMS